MEQIRISPNYTEAFKNIDIIQTKIISTEKKSGVETLTQYFIEHGMSKADLEVIGSFMCMEIVFQTIIKIGSNYDPLKFLLIYCDKDPYFNDHTHLLDLLD